MTPKEPSLSCVRFLNVTARAVIFAVVTCALSACGAWARWTDNSGHAAPSPAPYVCMPGNTQPSPAPTEPAPPDPDQRVDRQDPSLYDLAWSCSGILYSWDNGFKRHPNQDSTWCRFATDSSNRAVEYHVQTGSSCKQGKLLFTVKTDEYGRSYWLDPKLNIWLSTDDKYLVRLQGDTYCNGWQAIDLDSADGGAFFSADNMNCLEQHNRNMKLGNPASFQELKSRVNLWTKTGGWYDASHAPICTEQYQRRFCKKLQ